MYTQAHVPICTHTQEACLLWLGLFLLAPGIGPRPAGHLDFGLQLAKENQSQAYWGGQDRTPVPEPESQTSRGREYLRRHPDSMNVSRRIHSLRAHRQKAPSSVGPNWPCACSSKHCWGQEEQLPTIHTIYTVVILALLMVILGTWARKDM